MSTHHHNPVARAAGKAARYIDRMLADVDHESYTPLAPRHQDGSHVRPFQFNSNGGGH